MAEHMPDEVKYAAPRQAVKKTLVDAVLDGAIKAGSSMISLLSGLLATVLIAYSGYVLVDTFSTEQQASSSSWDLLQYKPEFIDDNAVPLYAPGLAYINDDYRAWLTVYDTTIDYPVMQAADDLYYASHDIYKRSSLTGAIYLASGNSADFSDSYNLIYGHHMDSGAMFGSLDQFAASAYFNAHREAIIVTPIGAFDIEFFAALSTDAYESRIYAVGDRAADVLDFVASGGAGGVGLGTRVLQYDAELAATADKVIALSTCASGDGTSGRLVVLGKMTERIETVDLTVTKVWDDNNDQDGARPEKLIMTLSNGDTVELNADNEWTATIEGLVSYAHGQHIAYSWSEENVPGYALVSVETEENLTTFTNRYALEMETTSRAVRKVWADDENRDGLRPGDLTVRLLGNGTVISTAVLNADNGWAAQINNLPANESGTPITYTWEEDEVTGYTLSSEENGGETVLTNTHIISVTDRTLNVVWVDDNDRDGLRPASLTVRLLANGRAAGTVTVNADNGWSASLRDLPLNENGKAITYTWEEQAVDEYALIGNVTSGRTTTFTYEHRSELISVSIRKLWADHADRNGTRPKSLTVYLMQGGQLAGSVELSPRNSWMGTISNLPRFDAGQELEYTWVEPAVHGYEQTGVEISGTRTTLTNTLIEEDTPGEEYTLTVHYRYLNGNTAAPTVTETHRAGERYNVESPVISGYKASLLRVTGTMPARNAEFTVIYTPNGTTVIEIDDLETPLGLGQVYINTGDCLE